MAQTLDDEIFNSFISAVKINNILSENNAKELSRLFIENDISAEDWGILIDKDCFPPKKAVDDAK